MSTVTLKEIYTQKEVEGQARADALQCNPPPDLDGLAPFEQALLKGYCQAAEEVARNTRKQLEELDGQIKKEVESGSSSEKADILFAEKEFENRKEELREDLQLDHLKEDTTRLKSIFEDHLGKINRMPRNNMPHWAYLLLIFLIAIGEFPLNLLVFKVFGDSPLENYAIAAVIAIILPLSAHVIGSKLTTLGYKFSWGRAIGLSTLTILVVAALFVLAIIRQGFLASHMQDMGLTQRLVHASFLFFWINLLIFAATTALSSWVSDPVEDYPQIYRDLQKSRARWRKAKAKLNKMLKDYSIVRDKKIQKTAVEKTSSSAKATELKGKYDAILVPAKHAEATYLAELQRKVQIYRTTNTQFRPDKLTPACFATQASFPLHLDSLSEKLNNEI